MKLVCSICILLLACPGLSQVPVAGQGKSRGLEQVSPRVARTDLPMPVFEFHSGFWLNLHHVLYEQARIREQRPTRRTDDGRLASRASISSTAELPAAEAAEWNDALDYYAAVLASRDLLFDGDLVNINNRLGEMENCDNLSGRGDSQCASGLRKELIAALERAAPVYRARWWSEHDRRNRAWISEVSPLVQGVGATLAAQLSLLHHVDWPGTRLRVDMSAYAGLLGGYTSLDPLHMTISSIDERNQGARGLVVLFAEASFALGLPVRDAIAREFRARSRPIPRELWAALLLYTATEVMRRAASGIKSFPPLTGADMLAARGWRNFRGVLDNHWQPYLEIFYRGKAEPDGVEYAIGRIADAL